MRSTVEFRVIPESPCLYQDWEEADICGLPTIYGMVMPFDVPSMPLCIIHAYEFRDWTVEDTIREFVEVMTEEEFLKVLEDDIDDDSEE